MVWVFLAADRVSRTINWNYRSYAFGQSLHYALNIFSATVSQFSESSANLSHFRVALLSHRLKVDARLRQSTRWLMFIIRMNANGRTLENKHTSVITTWSRNRNGYCERKQILILSYHGRKRIPISRIRKRFQFDRESFPSKPSHDELSAFPRVRGIWCDVRGNRYTQDQIVIEMHVTEFWSTASWLHHKESSQERAVISGCSRPWYHLCINRGCGIAIEFEPNKKIVRQLRCSYFALLLPRSIIIGIFPVNLIAA